MIINVRYVLLLAFRGLLLSLKLSLNSKTLSISYCNSSIFLQCSATVQGLQDMHGRKIRRAVFLHISIRLPAQLFALRTFLTDAKLADNKSNTRAHTHAWPGSSHRTSHWQHESKNVAVLPKIHSSDFVFFMSVFRPPCRFPREAIRVYMWRRTLKVHIRHIKVPPAGTGQRW